MSSNGRGKDELTPKQQAFVLEYLVDLNATRAYIRAGYKPKAAEVSAAQLLRNPKVQAEIRKLTAERSKRLELDADSVLRELANIAFSNPEDFFPSDGTPFNFAKLSRDQKASLEFTIDTSSEAGKSTRRVRIRPRDKVKALELLGRHLKMWTDRHEVVGLPDWEDFGQRIQAMRKQIVEKPN